MSSFLIPCVEFLSEIHLQLRTLFLSWAFNEEEQLLYLFAINKDSAERRAECATSQNL
jgi:hypothetical protein